MKTRNFNYFLIVLIALGPFVAYISLNSFNVGPNNLLSFITIIAFILWGFGNLETGRKIKIPKYLWYFMGFLVYTVLSDVFLVGKIINVKYIYTNRVLDTLLIFILIENTSFSKIFIKYLYKILIFLISIAFVTILIQQFYSYSFFVDMSKQNVFDYLNTINFQQRLPSIYSWQGLLEVGFSFLPMLAIIIEDNVLKKKSFYMWFWLFTGLLFSFFSKGRWMMLNYLILLLIPFIHFRKSFKKMVFSIIVAGFVIFFSVSVADYFGAPVYGIIENRILEKSHGGLEQGSASTRILAFYVFGQLFPEHPFLGKGDFHTFNKRTDRDYKLAAALGGRSSQIHVGYLSLLYYYGIIGGGLFLMFLYLLMKRLYFYAKITGRWAPFLGMLGFVLANTTLVNFDLFHAGLIIVLVFNNYYVANYYTEISRNEYLMKKKLFINA